MIPTAQANQLAYDNVPVRLPRRVCVGYPPHQSGNRFLQLPTGRTIVEHTVLPIHYFNASWSRCILHCLGHLIINVGCDVQID